MLLSDLTDYILSSINSYQGTPLAGQLDQSSIETGDLLLTLFKFILIPALILVIYWSFVMAQKPNRPW